jgi:hypothetical protein
MAAEGFRRLLGRPALGLLQTVIRESIQNVLDASRQNQGPIVLVRLRRLDERQRAALTGDLLADRPANDATRADIDTSLAKNDLRVLEICDFGTEGLSGPTRADSPHDGGEPFNFVNFLRNVGAARDTHHGGGTYGYGKSSLYAMSSCATIVVDSQTRFSGRDTRRVMACHLGAAFDADDGEGNRRRFTGRHWWGIPDGKDSIEPVTDVGAMEIATALGMPRRSSVDTGTSVMIVDPVLSDDDPAATVDDIIEAVLWNFWPRMVDSTLAHRRLKVAVELDGTPIAVPAPEEFPPLDLFASAMAKHRSGSGDLQEIHCGKPRRLLGRLAKQHGLRADRTGPAVREKSLIPRQASHIALMRPVELVVKYVVGDPLPDQRFDWVGVFVCSDEDEVEAAFASAEPPAHDDWIPDNLPKGNAKTFVNVALRHINGIARPHGSPVAAATNSDEKAPSLAATASMLGAMLGEVSATGPGKPTRPTSRRSPRRPLNVSSPRFVGLAVIEGKAVARFVADIENDGSIVDLCLLAEPYLVMDGGSTSDDDLPDTYELGVERIVFGGIVQSDGSPWIRVGNHEGQVEIVVRTINDAAVGVRLMLQAGCPA